MQQVERGNAIHTVPRGQSVQIGDIAVKVLRIEGQRVWLRIDTEQDVFVNAGPALLLSLTEPAEHLHQPLHRQDAPHACRVQQPRLPLAKPDPRD